MPGYGVFPFSWVHAATIRIKPIHPAGAATDFGSRDHAQADNAIMPPVPSSQARVGSEKYAHGGSVRVQISEIAKDSAATAATTLRYGNTADDPIRRRRANHAVTAISAGQSR